MPENSYQRYSGRFFRVSPLLTRPGWYARLREGRALGPFTSKESARTTLCELFGLKLEPCEDVNTLQHYAADCRLP